MMSEKKGETEPMHIHVQQILYAEISFHEVLACVGDRWATSDGVSFFKIPSDPVLR